MNISFRFLSSILKIDEIRSSIIFSLFIDIEISLKDDGNSDILVAFLKLNFFLFYRIIINFNIINTAFNIKNSIFYFRIKGISINFFYI